MSLGRARVPSVTLGSRLEHKPSFPSLGSMSAMGTPQETETAINEVSKYWDKHLDKCRACRDLLFSVMRGLNTLYLCSTGLKILDQWCELHPGASYGNRRP